MSFSLSQLLPYFKQFKDGNNYVLTRNDFTSIIDNNKNIKKKKPMCSFFVWLNDNRQDIDKTYFSDFYSINDWNIDFKKQYYNSKGLDSGKVVKEGRPRIASLITSKAGIIWKQLDTHIKNKYENKANNLKLQNVNSVNIESVVKEKKKRGRPRKNKQPENISDAIIEKYNNQEQNTNSDEIKVEEIDYNGKTYYLDVNTFEIYDPETQEVVGKKNGCGIYIN